MLVRIVRMTFKPEKKEDFRILFEKNKLKIRASQGCRDLQLLQDVEQANILITYSLWDSQKHLNIYRNTSFFKEVWAQTKVMFAEKPMAFSSVKVEGNLH